SFIFPTPGNNRTRSFAFFPGVRNRSAENAECVFVLFYRFDAAAFSRANPRVPGARHARIRRGPPADAAAGRFGSFSEGAYAPDRTARREEAAPVRRISPDLPVSAAAGPAQDI